MKKELKQMETIKKEKGTSNWMQNKYKKSQNFHLSNEKREQETFSFLVK